MSVAGTIRKKVVDAAYPALAGYYRPKTHRWTPPILFKMLGIAHPSIRPDFYTVSRALDKVMHVQGTIAECGVYTGSTLLGMANWIRKTPCREDWKIIGFDSFEGFPEPVEQDAVDGSFHPHAMKGYFSDACQAALQRQVDVLGYSKEITLVKGFFEDTLPQYSDKTFALAHIDCDLYNSYVTCLEFFYPRMAKHGYMVFDEYDFSAPIYPGAQKAIDEFFADKPEKVQRFPEATSPRYFIVKE